MAARGRAFFSVPILTTFSLGVWQVRRLRRKRTLIDDRTHRLSASELTVSDLASHPDPEYHPIRVRGRFLHEMEKHVGPRSAPANLPTPVLQWGGSSGLQIVTPCELEDGSLILVNRGWIPQRVTNPQKRVKAAITPHPYLRRVDRQTSMQDYGDNSTRSDLVDFVGVVRRGDERNRFTPTNLPDRNEWFYIDPVAMLDQEYVIELLDPLPEAGWPYPRDREEFLNFRTPPSTHVTYATTWFSLSAALALLARSRLRK